MSEKKDSASKRLKNSARQASNRRAIDRMMESAGMMIWPSGEANASPVPRGANIFVVHNSETSIRRAFKAFKLDPGYLTDWRRLVVYFAEAHFGGKRAGAPTRWTDLKCAQLFLDYCFICQRNPDAKGNTIRNLMRTEPSFNGRYKDVVDNTLSKQIKRAIGWAIARRQQPRPK